MSEKSKKEEKKELPKRLKAKIEAVKRESIVLDPEISNEGVVEIHHFYPSKKIEFAENETAEEVFDLDLTEYGLNLVIEGVRPDQLLLGTETDDHGLHEIQKRFPQKTLKFAK